MSSRSPRPTTEIQRLHKAIGHTVEMIGNIRRAVSEGYYVEKDISSILIGLEILYQNLLGRLKIASAQ